MWLIEIQLRYCANFFVGQKEFGSGTFGGSLCYWSYHKYDDCVYNTLKTNVGDSYGASADILATGGIVLGGVVALGAAISSGICLFRSYQRHAAENNPTPANPGINTADGNSVVVEVSQDPEVTFNEADPLRGRLS